MNIQQIIREIQMGADVSNEDLNLIVEAVRYRRTQLGRQTARSLRIGDRVSFVGRRGYTEGIVKDIKIKNVIVREGQLNWKVPASMLTLVEKETA